MSPSPSTSSTPSSPARETSWALAVARLAAAAGVVLTLLLALPLAAVHARVAVDPLRYSELGSVVPLLWTWTAFAATGLALARLGLLWSRRPPTRSEPLRTGARACLPGVPLFVVMAVLSLLTGVA